MLVLQFEKTPYLGVHQTGSRPAIDCVERRLRCCEREMQEVSLAPQLRLLPTIKSPQFHQSIFVIEAEVRGA
jgi:hypothetical protein